MTKLTRDTWLDIGLKALAETGPDGLKLTALCRRARVTRGSFYHYFKDQAAYGQAVLAHWSQTCTRDVIDEVERTAQTAHERRLMLSRVTARLDARVERGIRRWAAVDEAAREALEHADALRIHYVAQLNAREFGLDEGAARDLARIEYALYLGFPQADPEADEAETLRVSGLFDRMMRAWALNPDPDRP